MAADGQKRSLSCLPGDVLERILALLPLKSKLRCRCVCKSWNSILSSDNILSFTTNSMSRGRVTCSDYGAAWFLLTTKGPFACAMEPTCNLWLRVPNPTCPGASILAAGHDLVCIGNQVSECRSLIIFNLANDSWKLLPNMLHVGLIHKVTMIVDPVTKTYVIVVTGENSSAFQGCRRYRLLTEVYDSVLGSWQIAGDALPEAKFGTDPGLWCDGLFYCLTELPYGLTAFSLAKGYWVDLKVDMPQGMTSPSLLSCMGKLMMVGVQEKCSCKGGIARLDHPTSNFPFLPALRAPAILSRMRFLLTRSLSWSGPLHTTASSQLWTTMTVHPSAATRTSQLSSPVLSFSPPTSPFPSSWSSSTFSSPPLSPTSSPMSSDSSSLSPETPPPLRSIKVWALQNGKRWKLCEEMPEELCADFMSHLTPRTALVSAGVGDDVCVTSHRSPNVAVLNMQRREWRYAVSDPLFPRCRDAHLLGFTVMKTEKMGGA